MKLLSWSVPTYIFGGEPMVRELNVSENQPSVQEEIFNTLLRTPHRSVDEFLVIHKEQMERDPFLYGCLATHAVHHGECAVRDIQDVFLATLFVSEFPEHREAAWHMFQDLPPFRARRIVQYITGWAKVVTHTSQDKAMPTNGEFGVTYSRHKYSKNHHDAAKKGKQVKSRVQKLGSKLRSRLKTSAAEITIDQWIVKHKGHGKSMNRVLRGAIKNFLTYREETEGMLEGAILRARSALRFLYAKAHLVPGGSDDHWINRCLFHNEAPEGSRIEAMKKIIESEDPAEQAEIIMAAKLPYPVVRSLVKTVTPSVLIALIDAMSPQELLANLASIKREGAFNNVEIKGLIQNKIKDIQNVKKSKVDAFKGNIAAEAVADLDEDTKKLVQDATDAQLKQHGKIGVPTVLVIDKSASMGKAIELGKQVGASIAQAAGDNFAGCYLFDYNPVRIRWTKADGDQGSFSAWNKKLAMHRCGGATNLGGVLRSMINEGVRAEQIVIITDEGENGRPEFHELLSEYKSKFGMMPDIVIVSMGRHASFNRNKVVNSCKNAGATVNAVDVQDIDKISIPNLIQLLSKKSIFDLVQEILQLPLPTKEEWFAKRKAIKAAKTKRTKTSAKRKVAKKSSKTSGHPVTV